MEFIYIKFANNKTRINLVIGYGNKTIELLTTKFLDV